MSYPPSSSFRAPIGLQQGQFEHAKRTAHMAGRAACFPASHRSASTIRQTTDGLNHLQSDLSSDKLQALAALLANKSEAEPLTGATQGSIYLTDRLIHLLLVDSLLHVSSKVRVWALVPPGTAQAEPYSSSAPEAACVIQADAPNFCFQTHLSIRAAYSRCGRWSWLARPS